MEVLDFIAGLVGITATQLIIVFVAVVVLTIGWFILKQAVKIAARIFAIGCFTIIVVVGALYLYFVFFQ
jgi:hypothetical protein